MFDGREDIPKLARFSKVVLFVLLPICIPKAVLPKDGQTSFYSVSNNLIHL